MPADTHLPSHCRVPPAPIPCSIRYNYIGDEGASALAAVLKETIISILKCAAANNSVRFCVSAPLTSLRPHSIHSDPRSQSRVQRPHRRGQAGAPRRRGQQCPHQVLASGRGAPCRRPTRPGVPDSRSRLRPHITHSASTAACPRRCLYTRGTHLATPATRSYVLVRLAWPREPEFRVQSSL